MRIPPEDATVLGLCAHGQTGNLDKGGFEPHWLTAEISREMVSAAIGLHREGKDVNALSIMARARIKDREAIGDLITIFKNGYGTADFQDAVSQVRDGHRVRQAMAVHAELGQMLQSPRTIDQWLPTVTTKLVQLIRDGDTYDARPSAHLAKPLPQVQFQSLVSGYNEIMRGGYRNGMLIIWAMPSKHGKTTALTTHAVDLLLQRQKVAVIRTENSEEGAAAEIISALSLISVDEIASKTFEGNEYETADQRRDSYKNWKDYCDEYLRIYGWEWCNDERVKRIIKWEKPFGVILDYMKKQTGMFTARTNSQDELGDFADFLLRVAKNEGVFVASAGQINNDDSKKIINNPDSDEQVILYGTSRVGHAADIFAVATRHATRPYTADVRVQFDRPTGRLDSRHELPFDYTRRIYAIPKLIQGEL